MTIHTINPDALKDSLAAQAAGAASANTGGASGGKPADGGKAGAVSQPETLSQDEQSEAAKRFSRDVGKKLPPDVGSQEPL
ncbi:hypothetical protein [Undibacterium sp.]|uniref:hypothetical protein n=1 Tax=Undibacterium sp. TaxID=1914977 RepID=UPI00374CDE82